MRVCKYLDQRVRTIGEQNAKSFKVVSKTKKKKEIDEEIESRLSFYYPFPVVENSLEKYLQMYFMVRFRDFKWKGTKISTLILEAKYYLVGQKIILMALYSIFLKNYNSLFLPLE